MLVNASLPASLRDAPLLKQYEYFKKMYTLGHTYILLNDVSVFAPYPKPNVSWDISEFQKIATYNPEVTKVLTWIKTRIIINLAHIDYRTMGVLVRIATGMLNKCDIPKEAKIMFHDNMVKNLDAEYYQICTSELPF